MPDLAFDVLSIRPEQYAAAPQLTARVRLTESTGEPVHAVALHCQVRIEPQRRGYASEDESGLLGLFGPRARWTSTLKPFLWLQTGTMVQGFTEETEADLPLPCTYDFDVTASKYLHALHDGAVPLALLFSGTVFSRGASGFSVQRIPWDREASYQLPVAAWRELMDLYYPNSGWLRLQRDLLEELAGYRASRGLTSWEETVRSLLDHAGEVVP